MAQTGDKVRVALNAAFLVWDIASGAVGIVSFGTATVAKAGVRGLLKAMGKVAVSAVKKQMERLG